MTCVRSIKFTIPGGPGAPDVEVYAEEKDGSIVFTVTVLSTPTLTADLRGLFFNVADDAKLAGLDFSQTGDAVTDFDTENVIDLGNGANMRGKANPFDVGLEFGTQGIGKDDIQTATFTLSNTAGDLTLDDIAQVEFGARLTSIGVPGGDRGGSAKLTTVAPAAPDAVDDTYPNLFEDGASGLNDPSKTPQGILLHVLANDTDADGDILTITGFDGGPLHGTVQIVDGDDADLLPGDAILYTPDLDYAGEDSFVYCITDNNGGTDFAEVTLSIAAVADVPLLDYEVIAGPAVNQIILRVTATQNDADSSEYIDSLAWAVAGGLPAGVSIVPNTPVDPVTEPDQVVQDFLVTLPLDTDTSFDLTFTATAKETSNGDTETNSITVPIEFEYNLNEYQRTFLATDQSIWESGDQFVFVDDRFLGFEQSVGPSSSGGFFSYSFEAYVKAGLQSTLTFEGGEIDAQLPYDISIDTNYNKTTDVLLIGSSALLNGGGFTTEGPEGSYVLDFIFDYLLDVSAGLNLPDPAPDFDVIDIDTGLDQNTINLIDVDSEGLGFTLDLPLGFSLDFAWPTIGTTSDATNVYESSGASNNFLQLNLDVDRFAFNLFGLPSPFEIDFEALGGAVFAEIDLIDLDVFGGLNFLQDFAMAVQGLPGLLSFEDGTTQAFTFGSDILINDASLIDAGGDGDGDVEFTLSLAPDVDLTNSTDLGFNIGYNFLIGRLEAGYDISVDLGFFDVGISDSVVFGPLYETGGSLPVASVEVYNDTFDLAFQSQDLVFAA